MVRRITDLLLIKNGEQSQVLYFLVLFFFVGAGMAIGRGASEALFFKRYGIEYLPLMFIITSIILCSVSLLYAAFVDCLPSEKFYKILFITLAVLLFGNWYATGTGATDIVYPAFFLLYEVASELLLIHCAVYLNQNLVQTQSKRLTPIILAGHQIGIIFGGILLATTAPLLGVENMMLVWMLLLILSYIAISYWHRRNGVSPYFRAGRKSKSKLTQSITQVSQGMRLLKTSRLLRMSSLSLFFMVISVYILAYAVNSVYTESFQTEESLSAFFGILTAVTGMFALLIQLFLTNRIIRDHGIKKVNYIFPLTSIFSYSSLLFSFLLPSAIIASINKETLMPAFAKPVRNIFISSLPTQVQGRAQAISVITVIPLGLACAGTFLLFAQDSNNIQNFLIVGLVCSLAYLFFNKKMNAAYAEEILSNLKKRLFIPDKQTNNFMEGNQDELIKDIEQGLMNDEDNISIIYARILSKSNPGRAANLIPKRMNKASNATKDQMVKILQPIESANLNDYLKTELGKGDKHLDATLYKALFQSRVPEEKNQVATLLSDENPRIKAAGIYGTLYYPIPELIETAVDEWILLLENAHVENYMPAVELIIPEFKELYRTPPLLETVKQKIKDMLLHSEIRFIRIALNVLSTWPAGSFDDIEDTILNLYNHTNWMIRKSCIKSAPLLSEKKRNSLLLTALEDPHPNVRTSAIEILASHQLDDIAYIQSLLISNKTGSPKVQQTMLEYLMEAGCDSRTMHAISLSFAHDALNIKYAVQYLKESHRNQEPAMILLTHALEERTAEISDLSLFAIQSSSHDEDITLIRAGLNSDDKRQFSNACELLTMINNQEIASLILPLYEECAPVKKMRHERLQFDNLNTLIKWIKDRSDPWLTECATYLQKQ